MRKIAKKATERCNRRMIKKHLKANPPSEYKIGENVYIRLSRKTKPLQKRRFVLEAIVLKRNLKRHSYKVSYRSPTSEKTVQRWLQVDDITSLTLKDEKRKQKIAKSRQERKIIAESHRKKYLIPITTYELRNSF